MKSKFSFKLESELSIFYDLENTTRATSISYVGSSVTTYSKLNPGYKIYTVDGFYTNSTWQILDMDTTFMNLTAANLYNVTNWQHEYSAKVRIKNKASNLYSKKYPVFVIIILKERLQHEEFVSARLGQSSQSNIGRFRWTSWCKIIQVI